MQRRFCMRKDGRPEWGALCFLAAAVVVAAAAVVPAAVVAAAAPVAIAAAVAEQQDQNDDPPPVVAVAHIIVAAHNSYLQDLLERRSAHVPWYDRAGKMCGGEAVRGNVKFFRSP